jgi:hypothetical protein
MNLKQPSHKNIFFSYEWLRKYFLPTHFVNPVQDYYICKPITGLSLTSVNFFQDESLQILAVVRAGRINLNFSS